MKFKKGTPEFEYNLDAMHELEDCVPMTRPERTLLHYWVQFGNDIDTIVDQAKKEIPSCVCFKTSFNNYSRVVEYD